MYANHLMVLKSSKLFQKYEHQPLSVVYYMYIFCYTIKTKIQLVRLFLSDALKHNMLINILSRLKHSTLSCKWYKETIARRILKLFNAWRFVCMFSAYKMSCWGSSSVMNMQFNGKDFFIFYLILFLLKDIPTAKVLPRTLQLFGFCWHTTQQLTHLRWPFGQAQFVGSHSCRHFMGCPLTQSIPEHPSYVRVITLPAKQILPIHCWRQMTHTGK